MVRKSLFLLALCFVHPAGAQTAWTLRNGPLPPSIVDNAPLFPAVPPPYLPFVAPPPLAAAFPALSGGTDVNRLTGTVWVTDGLTVVNLTTAGAILGLFPVPPAVGPLNGLAVNPFAGTLWVTTGFAIANLTPAGVVLGIFPLPPALTPATGIAYDTYAVGGALYVVTAAGAVGMFPPGPVPPGFLFFAPGVLLPPAVPGPPTYTGLGFDTSVPPPGRVLVAAAPPPIGPAVLALPLPLGGPSVPVVPFLPGGAPAGIGMDPQPLSVTPTYACPYAGPVLGSAGGWPVVPNPVFALTITAPAGVPTCPTTWYLALSVGVFLPGIPLGPSVCGLLHLLPPVVFLASGPFIPPGPVVVPVPIPPGFPPGLAVYFQAVAFCDPLAPACPVACPPVFISLSNCLQVTISGI